MDRYLHAGRRNDDDGTSRGSCQAGLVGGDVGDGVGGGSGGVDLDGVHLCALMQDTGLIRQFRPPSGQTEEVRP
jgi:hypothetical protein